MIIKETPWEKRNLGVDTSVEYYFGVNDNEKNIDDIVWHDSLHSYQVAHLPVGNMVIVNKLLDSGFKFAETKIELTADLKTLLLPELFNRYSDGMDYHEADSAEREKIYDTMRAGIFATDKVALDPLFNAHIAGNRYACWTEESRIEGKVFLYVVTKGEEQIGFFVLKKSSERLGDSFLAGLFDKEKYSGLGFSVLYYPMVEAKRIGLKKMITGVSSNNPDSVKMHMALGYQIKGMDYTFVKHL